MDPLLLEHERLVKKGNLSKSIDDVQATINLLAKARKSIASDPDEAQSTLAKLQNPVKQSFDRTNDSLKGVYSGLGKYQKALDKNFKSMPLLNADYDALSSHPTLINRAIAMHLLREGQFSVASKFLAEAAAKPPTPLPTPGSPNPHDATQVEMDLGSISSEFLQQRFADMYYILDQLRNEHNPGPAIQWARNYSEMLEARGSNLEFELVKLQFIWLFMGKEPDTNQSVASGGLSKALEYARREFSGFQSRYLREIQQLVTGMAYVPNLQTSPYRHIFHNDSAWEEVANSFTREFCSLLGLSADSPLYIATTAGAIALPTLLKLAGIMKDKRTEWTTQEELPVEIALPPSYHFHSIFVCPVSKEQSTEENPPMMQPCGHVIAQESLARLSKGSRFKCPYCPGESHPSGAKRVYL